MQLFLIYYGLADNIWESSFTTWKSVYFQLHQDQHQDSSVVPAIKLNANTHHSPLLSQGKGFSKSKRFFFFFGSVLLAPFNKLSVLKSHKD